MAKFNVVGFDDVEKALIARGEAVTPAVDAMLQAGAEVLVEAQKAESKAMGVYDTGDFHNSIKATPIKENADGRYLDVYPQGKDRKGVRNATKGFVAEYGKKNVPARPWLSSANEKCSSKLHEAMRAKWSEVMGDGS